MTTPLAQAQTLTHVNAMQTPTWYRLHVNDTDVMIPDGLSIVRDVQIDGYDESGQLSLSAFENAVSELQSRIDQKRTAASKKTDGHTSFADEDSAENLLDEAALSTSERISHDIESTGSISEAFKTGMGPVAHDWLCEMAGAPHIVVIEPNQKDMHVTARIPAIANAVHIAAIDVIAAPNSHLTLGIIHTSNEPDIGIVGNMVRVFAGKDAQVDIIVTQALDESWISFDNEGMILDQGAQVNVRHTTLGASIALTGLAADLRGDNSSISIDTRYLGHNLQKLDFNYLISHHGRNTESTMNANGVLAGSSEKTLRGTIDLINGCKGAAGQETETVLLADKQAINHTVPVILCSEDDVAGNHGATIGHVRPEQRFYLESRGLSDENIERLFTRSVLEEAYLNAPSAYECEAIAHRSLMLLQDNLEDLSE